MRWCLRQWQCLPCNGRERMKRHLQVRNESRDGKLCRLMALRFLNVEHAVQLRAL